MNKFLIALCSIVLISCTEKTKVNLVSGTLFNNCTDVLPNSEIALKANVSGSFTEPIILGSAISDSQGNFNFTYELEEEDNGTGNIILVQQNGFETIVENIELNENRSFNIYRSNSTEVAIKAIGNRVFSSSDTLFYGFTNTNSELSLIQPVNNSFIDTIQISSTINLSEEQSTILYYGVGTADFNLSKEATTIQDSVFQNVTVVLGGCGEFVQTEVEFN